MIDEPMIPDEIENGKQYASPRERRIQQLAERLVLAGRAPAVAIAAAVEFTEICEQRLEINDCHKDPIETLNLGGRAIRILRTKGIARIEQLALLTRDDLQGAKDCGKVTTEEILEAADAAGVRLRSPQPRTWD